uniref:Putative ovule protein n=1 Tax=Solanum chacoense TaxID=4108 RepID=A0A0V0H9P7_SOLCH
MSSPVSLHMKHQLAQVSFLFLKFSAVKITPLVASQVKKHTFLVALGIHIEVCGYTFPSLTKRKRLHFPCSHFLRTHSNF